MTLTKYIKWKIKSNNHFLHFKRDLFHNSCFLIKRNKIMNEREIRWKCPAAFFGFELKILVVSISEIKLSYRKSLILLSVWEFEQKCNFFENSWNCWIVKMIANKSRFDLFLKWSLRLNGNYSILFDSVDHFNSSIFFIECENNFNNSPINFHNLPD